MAGQIVPVLWDEDCVTASVYHDMMQGIRTASHGKYSIEIFSSAAAIEQNLPRGSTVIVLGYESPKLEESLHTLTTDGYQVVLSGLDGERFGAHISCATPDRRKSMNQLVKYLFQCGRRRVALVGCGSSSVNDRIRCQEFHRLLRGQGCQQPAEHIFYFREDVMESIEKFTACHDAFDAVICPIDYTALCLLRHCQNEGIRIPEDLYLCAFSNRQVGRYCSPSITTMALDFKSVGECAFLAWNLLHSHAEQRLCIQITTPSRLIVRQSTNNTPCTGDGDDLILSDPNFQGEPFYSDQMIATVMQIENCLAECDALDLRIIQALCGNKSYEQIGEQMFISSSALCYRLKKIFSSASVRNRKEFVSLFQTYFTEEMNI